MSQDLSAEDWEQIKLFATKSQAILILLKSFDEITLSLKSNKELQIMQEQLKRDFYEAMTQLIELIEKYDCQ
jgi:hypothetical protein